MNTKTNKLTQLALITLIFGLSAALGLAQGPSGQSANTQKTNSRMLYHDGPLRTGVQDVYFIFYGCWTTNACANVGDATTMLILSDFMSTVGNTPYMQINSTYTDSAGQPATAALVYGGSVVDNSYSHGVELTRSDIEGIISDQITSFNLPQDPSGIYVVVASADISSTATGFCIPGTHPFHSDAIINGGHHTYIFLGNPRRCPSAAAPYVGQPSPNGDFAGDALVLNLTHALNGLLTNPYGNGWYDRYNLENSDKCTGVFGAIYTTANGGRANIRFGVRDFLIEENWLNTRKATCALSQ